MARLDAFLKADDLDDLLKIAGDMSWLTPEESARVQAIIHDWSDRQAVANLLVHPGLMPASVRVEALDRGLRSHDFPYFMLAATVGLQNVSAADVPIDTRAAWTRSLLDLVQSTSSVLAGRASVTLAGWSADDETSEIVAKLAALYPVPDESACRNIIAAVLAKCGELSPVEFSRRVAEWRVPDGAAAALRAAHDEYITKKAVDAYRAMIMKMPALAYIPNLSEGVRASAEPAVAESPGIMTPGRLVAGVIAALAAKVGSEILMTYGFGQPLYRCSGFVDNRSCSFFEWLTNEGDIIVMVPAFVLAWFMVLVSTSRR